MCLILNLASKVLQLCRLTSQNNTSSALLDGPYGELLFFFLRMGQIIQHLTMPAISCGSFLACTYDIRQLNCHSCVNRKKKRAQ